MPQAVQHELSHTGNMKSLAVLLFQARWLDMPTLEEPDEAEE
jgi:hypothetical protein